MKSENIQAILFSTNSPQYSISKERLNFIKKMKIKPLKRVHRTEHYYRYRIRDPSEFKRFKSVRINNYIIIIYGFN